MRTVNVHDVWGVVRSHWILVSVLPLIAAFMAWWLARSVEPVWGAVALIKVGEMPASEGHSPRLIETTETAVRRLRQHAKESLALPVGNGSQGISDRVLFAEMFIARVIPDTNMIELRVQARSGKEARDRVLAAVSYLRETHAAVTKPIETRLAHEVRVIQEQATLLRQERNEMLKMRSQVQCKNPELYVLEKILLQNTIGLYNELINKLEERNEEVEAKLYHLSAHPTALVGAVRIDDRPSRPDAILAALLSWISASLAAIGVAMILKVRQSKTV